MVLQTHHPTDGGCANLRNHSNCTLGVVIYPVKASSSPICQYPVVSLGTPTSENVRSSQESVSKRYHFKQGPLVARFTLAKRVSVERVACPELQVLIFHSTLLMINLSNLPNHLQNCFGKHKTIGLLGEKLVSQAIVHLVHC